MIGIKGRAKPLSQDHKPQLEGTMKQAFLGISPALYVASENHLTQARGLFSGLVN